MKLQIRTKQVVTKTFWVLNLKEFLESKGKTQSDMAKKFGFSRSYISDIALIKKPLKKEMKIWLESL